MIKSVRFLRQYILVQVNIQHDKGEKQDCDDESFWKNKPIEIDDENKRLKSAEMSQKLEEDRQFLKQMQQFEEKEENSTNKRKIEQYDFEQQRGTVKEKHSLDVEKIDLERKEQKAKEKLAEQEAIHKEHLLIEQERQKQKALLLAKMKAIDDGNFANEQKSMHTFSNGNNNHQENNSNIDDFGLTFGDYKPSFLTDVNNKTKFSKTKSKLSDQHDVLLMDNPGYSGDDHHSSPNSSVLENRNSSPSKETYIRNVDQRDGQLLPRRTRQPVMAVTRNADISVIDDLGDDIEEVTL